MFESFYVPSEIYESLRSDGVLGFPPINSASDKAGAVEHTHVL